MSLPTAPGLGSSCSTGMGAVYGVAPTGTLHNVRFSKSARVLYPNHPLFNIELEAFGGAGGQRDLIYVKLADSTTRGIPAWMFDEAICAGLHAAERATIDYRSLLRLAQLLDSVQESLRTGQDENHTGTQIKSTETTASIATGSPVGSSGGEPTNPECESDEVCAITSRVTGKRRSAGKHRTRRVR